jgi:hypothetical protein
MKRLIKFGGWFNRLLSESCGRLTFVKAVIPGTILDFRLLGTFELENAAFPFAYERTNVEGAVSKYDLYISTFFPSKY